VDRQAAQILLVEAHVQDVALAEQVDNQRARPELEPKEVKAGLLQHADDLAEEHVDVAGPFLDDGIDAKDAEQPADEGLANQKEEEADHGDKKGDEDIAHFGLSRKTCAAFLYRSRRTLRK